MGREKKSLVSVVVPVYNVEKYVARCIESILSQSHEKMEVILVDDGSKDGSGRICDEYAKKDKRVRVIHKQNGGLSDARNVGLEEARGEYVSFVDSDDWMGHDMIRHLFDVAVKYQADIVECGFKEVYRDYMLVDYTCNGTTEQLDRIKAIAECMQWKRIKPVAWNKLYTRDVIGDIRYPVGKLHEDEFTTHKIIYNAKKIIFLDLALYNYDCTKEDSITAQFKEQNLDACEAMRQKIHFVLAHDDLKPLADIACNVYCFTLFDNLARSLDAGKLNSMELKKTIENALVEKEELFRHKIELLYKQCLNDLAKSGVEQSVRRWKKRKGISLNEKS